MRLACCDECEMPCTVGAVGAIARASPSATGSNNLAAKYCPAARELAAHIAGRGILPTRAQRGRTALRSSDVSHARSGELMAEAYIDLAPSPIERGLAAPASLLKTMGAGAK